MGKEPMNCRAVRASQRTSARSISSQSLLESPKLRRRAIGQKYLLPHNVLPVVIICPTVVAVAQCPPADVADCAGNRASFPAADDFSLKMVIRHKSRPSFRTVASLLITKTEHSNGCAPLSTRVIRYQLSCPVFQFFNQFIISRQDVQKCFQRLKAGSIFSIGSRGILPKRRKVPGH